MTKFEEGQIDRVSRGNHNREYLHYKIEQLAKNKHITVLQWIEQFDTDDDLTAELDYIDNEGRLKDYRD